MTSQGTYQPGAVGITMTHRTNEDGKNPFRGIRKWGSGTITPFD